MKRLPLALLAIAVSSTPLLAADATPALVPEKEVVLDGGGPVGRMAIDVAGTRLYVARADGVDAVDLSKRQRVGSLAGVERANGVALAPDGKHAFATGGKKGVLVEFEPATLKRLKDLPAGDDPQAVLYVASTKEVWVFGGTTNDVTVFDAVKFEKKTVIALEGSPYQPVEHPGRPVVYVTVSGEHDGVTAIDVKTKKVIANHPLAAGAGPKGLAIDVKTGRLFVGANGLLKLTIVDTTTWKSLADFDLPGPCEAVAYDAGTATAFVTCKNEMVVLRAKDPKDTKDAKAFQALASLETRGAKTCVLDPQAHRLIVATAPGRGEEGQVKALTFLPPK